MWIVWAYTPDWVLKSMGISYYPDRYWALAIPMYAMTLVIYLVVIYNAWNLCNTNPFESYYTIRGAASCHALRALVPCRACASRARVTWLWNVVEQTAQPCRRRVKTRTCRRSKQPKRFRPPKILRLCK
jgi:hypothetical protein